MMKLRKIVISHAEIIKLFVSLLYYWGIVT